MYCDKCGKEIKPEWKNCPRCGAALNRNSGGMNNNVNISGGPVINIIPEPMQQKTNMKWYMFIIYAQLFITAIADLFVGIRAITGMQYGNSKEQVYEFFGNGLRIADVLYGIVSILLAVVAIVIRQMLAKKKVNATNYYLIFIGIAQIVALLYSIASYIFNKNGAIIAAAVGSLLFYGVYIGLNYVYFQKRIHMFVN